MSVFILGSYAKALVMTTDRIPLAGETLIGRDFRQTWGGKGSDMAVQTARLGADVAYAGVVGDDAFGYEFVGLMQDEGIDIQVLSLTAPGIQAADTAEIAVADAQTANDFLHDAIKAFSWFCCTTYAGSAKSG